MLRLVHFIVDASKKQGATIPVCEREKSLLQRIILLGRWTSKAPNQRLESSLC